MPGTWAPVASIPLDSGGAVSRCRWADVAVTGCTQWADQGSATCTVWADMGSNQCCTWWPCSWACAFVYWVANLVCQVWFWVAKLVCVLSVTIAQGVCLGWEFASVYFSGSANGGPMFLLTDGTVLLNECELDQGTHSWWRLTPDARGDYLHGTWARAADSLIGRKYFASAVLADGRLLVCGGEYTDANGMNNGTPDDSNFCEIFDPVANAWTTLPAPPGVAQIGDSPCSVLPDGRFLLGNFSSQSCFIFDPSTDTWTAAASKGDSGSEETWVLMGEGTVIVPQNSTSPGAEKYIPQRGTTPDQWISTGTLVAPIVDPQTDAIPEVGPGVLLPDGRAFFVGANGNTALYAAGANPGDPGTWAAGPGIPNSGTKTQGAKDGPGALLPSGTVLFPAAPVDLLTTNSQYLSPCSFFEFDGAQISRSTDPPNADGPTYVGRMLVIPTGQVLWAREDSDRIFAFTETGSPPDPFRPAITDARNQVVRGTTMQLSGTQFNGLSQAVGYGDDCSAATNYPLVRIRNLKTGNVRYCRTFNHTRGGVGRRGTTCMAVATGHDVITTQVTVPADLELGMADLFVVANGIESAPHTIEVIE